MNMKQWLRAALSGVLLIGTLAVSAAAADYTVCADHLHQMGLFQGTDEGYALDRAPTRSEAAAMLVRLLGQEQAALGREYTAPFTDLEQWEEPYVQYLYDAGLTTGTSADTFSPGQACTAQMYAAFLLRALGYTEDAGDFAYAEAAQFAQRIGLYDPAVIDPAVFLRDDVAAASYTALSLQPKGQGKTLLDTLVEAGAVDEAAAQPYQALFSSYAAYREDTAGMQELERFSVVSSDPFPTEFLRDGEQVLRLQVADTTIFDRTANAMLTRSVRTVSAEGVEDASASAQLYLTDGELWQQDAESWHSQAVSAVEQARWMAGYMPVPIVWVQEIESTQGGWVISFAQVPPVYRGWLQPVEQVIGSLEQAEWRGGTVEQQTKAGQIVSQKLTVAFTVDGIYGQPVLVSRLEQTGDAVQLVPPV